jgi:hypothetical protein
MAASVPPLPDAPLQLGGALAVGFAAQDLLGNFVASVFTLKDERFEARRLRRPTTDAVALTASCSVGRRARVGRLRAEASVTASSTFDRVTRPNTHPVEPPHRMVSLASYWDELEPTALVVVGFVLFVIPEPATSTLGIGLMLLGIAWWFYEWDRP